MSKTVEWTIQKAFLHAQRKATPPTTGSKFEALLDIADSMQKMWANEDGVIWDSLYVRINIGTATVTDTFPIPATIEKVSNDSEDPILVGTQPYKLVKPAQLYKYKDSKAVARVASNLKFSKAFAADDSLLGSAITVPGQGPVPDITSTADIVAVDQPMWLAYMMAAEFIRADVVKRDQYDNLLALADAVMADMKANNGGSDEVFDSGGWSPAGGEDL